MIMTVEEASIGSVLLLVLRCWIPVAQTQTLRVCGEWSLVRLHVVMVVMGWIMRVLLMMMVLQTAAELV